MIPAPQFATTRNDGIYVQVAVIHLSVAGGDHLRLLIAVEVKRAQVPIPLPF